MSARERGEGDSALKDRGYFWSSDEPVRDGELVPASAVPGLLTIDLDGVAHLKLDGVISKGKSAFAAVMDGFSSQNEVSICGRLIGGNECVVLMGAVQYGGNARTSAISYHNFRAFDCLVGSKFPNFTELCVSSLDIPLTGFEEWMRLGSIEVTSGGSDICVKYTIPEDVNYCFDDWELSIKYNAIAPWDGGKHIRNAEIRETSCLVYTKKSGMDISRTQDQLRSIADFVLLLTDSDYLLEWPTAELVDGSRYKYYLYRKSNKAKPLSWHECPVNFNIIKDRFGEIFRSWMQKREDFGPGFYLYPGTRRGVQLYAEQQFASLIWGMESFHRTKYGDSPPSGEFKDKIERISSYIDKANKNDGLKIKDKKWLKRIINNAKEHTLSDRLTHIIQALPIETSANGVKSFAELCGRIRNELSHFGGKINEPHRKKSLEEIISLSEALGYVYHASILMEIGVDREIIKAWFDDGLGSHKRKCALVKVNLLEDKYEEKIKLLLEKLEGGGRNCG